MSSWRLGGLQTACNLQQLFRPRRYFPHPSTHPPGVPSRPGSGQRSSLLPLQRNYPTVKVSSNSLLLSESRPFGEMNSIRVFPLYVSRAALEKIDMDVSKQNVILSYIWCADAPVVTRLSRPVPFITWFGLGVIRGSWVLIPFTIWHISGQTKLLWILNSISINNYKGRIGWLRGDESGVTLSASPST